MPGTSIKPVLQMRAAATASDTLFQVFFCPLIPNCDIVQESVCCHNINMFNHELDIYMTITTQTS